MYTQWFLGFLKLCILYYTNWTLLLFLLWYLGLWHPFFDNTLSMMLLTSSVGGGYITYIHPKKVFITCFPVDIKLEGKLLMFLDLLTHHLPFFIGIQLIRPVDPNYVPFVFISILYLCLNSIKRYGLNYNDLINICLFVVFLNQLVRFIQNILILQQISYLYW